MIRTLISKLSALHNWLEHHGFGDGHTQYTRGWMYAAKAINLGVSPQSLLDEANFVDSVTKDWLSFNLGIRESVDCRKDEEVTVHHCAYPNMEIGSVLKEEDYTRWFSKDQLLSSAQLYSHLFAGPHHITFSVSGLEFLIREVLSHQPPVVITSTSDGYYITSDQRWLNSFCDARGIRKTHVMTMNLGSAFYMKPARHHDTLN